mgnify:CR=1 FL=1
MKKIPLWLLVIYWETYDRFLSVKMFTRSRIRLFWSRLWIRKNEFHQSLDIDVEAMLTMNEEQKESYMNDLARRRNIAHERELKTV